MAKIHLLEKQVAELIAAGEVVERPASIVKELVENAVDAGAKTVTIEIQDGGIRLIRVTDNGCGIARAEVELAFLRHATSKVRVSEDLVEIRTMGFRGEALASIAAMCRVELLTRTAEETAGTRFRIEGGEPLGAEDAGCPVGTTILVRDVFYNTPARMKFLKKDVTEGNSIEAVVEKAALAYPEVAFRLLRDGVSKLQTPGDGQLISAIRCVLGKAFAESTIPLCYESEGLLVEGFICKPQTARGSRTLQNFFVNRRFIRSKTCMAALEEAYRGALMTGRFPSCVLNLTIPVQTVDVNVHPAKIEVRFADEKSVFGLVYYGCKTALGASCLTPELKADEMGRKKVGTRVQELPAQPISPQLRFSAPSPRHCTVDIATPEQPVHTTKKPQATWPQIGRIATETKRISLRASDEPDTANATVPISLHSPQPVYSPMQGPSSEFAQATLEVREEESADLPQSPRQLYDGARLIGELSGTYLLLECETGLLLVDKHAAHERLLFNRLMQEGLPDDRQLLLSPIPVQLSPAEHAAALENQALLFRAGVTLEDFGNHFILIREVAPVLAQADLPALVGELIGKLLEANRETLVSYQLTDLYHLIACRAAIKAHDHTEALSLEALLALLQEEDDAQHCPHGRPVSVQIAKREIEKKFGRLG